eukprot:4544679-Pyramimonas_sp.AAC.1
MDGLSSLQAIATKQGQSELAKSDENATRVLQASLVPKPEASLHTRASQAQSTIMQLEKRLRKELGKLDRWQEAQELQD